MPFNETRKIRKKTHRGEGSEQREEAAEVMNSDFDMLNLRGLRDIQMGCHTGYMSLKVYREVYKNPIMALLTSSAGHWLALLPDWRGTIRDTDAGPGGHR